MRESSQREGVGVGSGRSSALSPISRTKAISPLARGARCDCGEIIVAGGATGLVKCDRVTGRL
jgi:hypothetical protein